MSFAASLAAADGAALTILGSPVVYAPLIGDPVTVTGIFDAAYLSVAVGGGDAAVQSYSPAVSLRLADLPVDPDDDEPRIAVGSTTYTVREVQKDGTGMAVFLLREVT